MFCWIIRMRVTRILIPIVPTLLLLIVPTLAHPDFQAGLAAYDQGDYGTALKEFLPLAQQGDAKAQFNMGILYEKGQGVPQDLQEAFRWYYLAAAQGDASTQNVLGMLYEYGQGVPQDFPKPCIGMGSRRSRATRRHNLTWGFCMPLVSVCHKIIPKLVVGIGLQRSKAMPMPSTTWVICTI